MGFENTSLEEWLVKTTQTMYRNAQNRVRVNGTFSDDFLVQAGLHQGLALNLLLLALCCIGQDVQKNYSMPMT